jgi:cyclopropane fatty-acyl-phospholipid synthase-like methyltransferase
MVTRYRELGVPANVELVAGAWPSVDVAGPFDRVLAYSVLHYVADQAAALIFIEAGLRMLVPGGAMLIGDVPNDDTRRRWLKSKAGQQAERHYHRQRSVGDAQVQERDRIFAQVTQRGAHFDDDFMITLMASMRRRGYEAYVLPQKESLPFNRSREDILVCRHG